jgi:hypothetical protein
MTLTYPCDYPKDLPLASIREVVRISRQRTIIPDRAVYARHLWTVQGYLQSRLLGDGELHVVSDLPGESMILAALEGLGNGGQGVTALPLSISVLLRWIVEKLLEQLAAA